MPEPKEPKRTFDAQTDNGLSGLRVVSQRAERAGAERPGHRVAGQHAAEQAADGLERPSEELVSKLIRFFGNFSE